MTCQDKHCAGIERARKHLINLIRDIDVPKEQMVWECSWCSKLLITEVGADRCVCTECNRVITFEAAKVRFDFLYGGG